MITLCDRDSNGTVVPIAMVFISYGGSGDDLSRLIGRYPFGFVVLRNEFAIFVTCVHHIPGLVHVYPVHCTTRDDVRDL